MWFVSLSVRMFLPVRETTRRTKTASRGGKISSPKRSAVSLSPASSTSRGGETHTHSRSNHVVHCQVWDRSQVKVDVWWCDFFIQLPLTLLVNLPSVTFYFCISRRSRKVPASNKRGNTKRIHLVGEVFLFFYIQVKSAVRRQPILFMPWLKIDETGKACLL